jgi:ankyrin repeat protein
MAAYKGHTDVVRLLLAGGVELGAIDPEGHDALWVAGMKGHDEIVELIAAKAVAPAGPLPGTH